jgi:hypothetical protein
MALRVAYFLLAIALSLAITATPVAASPTHQQAVSHSTPLFAGYWGEFIDHWTGKLKNQNSIILCALGVGAVGLFIITRGKWLK